MLELCPRSAAPPIGPAYTLHTVHQFSTREHVSKHLQTPRECLAAWRPGLQLQCDISTDRCRIRTGSSAVSVRHHWPGTAAGSCELQVARYNDTGHGHRCCCLPRLIIYCCYQVISPPYIIYTHIYVSTHLCWLGERRTAAGRGRQVNTSSKYILRHSRFTKT